jgi:hypothetical protein
MTRIGRPPTYRQRAWLKIYLEAVERRRLDALAQAAEIPTTTWARRVLVEAAGRDDQAPARAAAPITAADTTTTTTTAVRRRRPVHGRRRARPTRTA